MENREHSVEHTSLEGQLIALTDAVAMLVSLLASDGKRDAVTRRLESLAESEAAERPNVALVRQGYNDKIHVFEARGLTVWPRPSSPN